MKLPLLEKARATLVSAESTVHSYHGGPLTASQMSVGQVKRNHLRAAFLPSHQYVFYEAASMQNIGVGDTDNGTNW